MRSAQRRLLICAIASAASGGARAHGFEERYDLPLPLSYVVVGACTAVALTFVAAALFAGRGVAAAADRDREGDGDGDGDGDGSDGATFGIGVPVSRNVQRCTRTMAWLLFLLAIAAALYGSRDPLMNLAPTLIWIVWWVGLSLVAAFVCNVWPLLDPWRTTFDMLDGAARRFGRADGIVIGLRWPVALGQWPAVALLLGWCWLEVVYPLASSPFKLGCAAVLWTTLNVAGMAAFGRATWQSNADVFALVFSTLGRMAPLRLRSDEALPVPTAAGQAAFVMAMLATVIFDGLHGGAAWAAVEGMLRRTVPQWIDVNGYFAGTVGLVGVWLGFLLAYAVTLTASKALARPALGSDEWASVSMRLTLSLVPIAAGYNLAHNFSSLAIQGQTVVQLLSDPFGRQWDLFGTARFYPDIGLVDARLTWFVAVVAIVSGHALSIWWSHRVALGSGLPARTATVALLPLTVLMIACTALSLTLIAEPMGASPR